MLARQRHYSEEFRTEAIRLALNSGQSVRQTALDLGMSNETLSRWLRDDRSAAMGGVTLAGAERIELAELRRRVKVLESEREILRKAATFFAQESERTR